METDMDHPNHADLGHGRVWIEKLVLTNFRNYIAASLKLSPQPVVLTGENGSGKTNLLEAVSLLGSGKGLRGAPYGELTKMQDKEPQGCWAISSNISGFIGRVAIGTALKPASGTSASRGGRMVRIDGESKGSAAMLDRYSHIVWLTPALDGILTGPASDRRRFLDHLIIGLDPHFRGLRSTFERAMRQRNKLFELGCVDKGQFESLEIQMAEGGVALGAARLQAVDLLSKAVRDKWYLEEGIPVFPWSILRLDGFIEQDLRTMPAIEAEDHYFQSLVQHRERDRAARRTLVGPHRSDFTLTHGIKNMSGRLCSTGEQKALLVGLMLSYVEQVRQIHHGMAPVLLLDEVAAHLDKGRRAVLFEQILGLEAQVWMTGTDISIFAPLRGAAQFVTIKDNQLAVL